MSPGSIPWALRVAGPRSPAGLLPPESTALLREVLAQGRLPVLP